MAGARLLAAVPGRATVRVSVTSGAVTRRRAPRRGGAAERYGRFLGFGVEIVPTLSLIPAHLGVTLFHARRDPRTEGPSLARLALLLGAACSSHESAGRPVALVSAPAAPFAAAFASAIRAARGRACRYGSGRWTRPARAAPASSSPRSTPPSTAWPSRHPEYFDTSVNQGRGSGACSGHATYLDGVVAELERVRFCAETDEVSAVALKNGASSARPTTCLLPTATCGRGNRAYQETCSPPSIPVVASEGDRLRPRQRSDSVTLPRRGTSRRPATDEERPAPGLPRVRHPAGLRKTAQQRGRPGIHIIGLRTSPGASSSGRGGDSSTTTRCNPFIKNGSFGPRPPGGVRAVRDLARHRGLACPGRSWPTRGGRPAPRRFTVEARTLAAPPRRTRLLNDPTTVSRARAPTLALTENRAGGACRRRARRAIGL
jgi:hypothetical protein